MYYIDIDPCIDGECCKTYTKTEHFGASLVVQLLRIACQCKGYGFEPWAGKIPHATEQLSPCATTTEPVL